MPDLNLGPRIRLTGAIETDNDVLKALEDAATLKGYFQEGMVMNFNPETGQIVASYRGRHWAGMLPWEVTAEEAVSTRRRLEVELYEVRL